MEICGCVTSPGHEGKKCPMPRNHEGLCHKVEDKTRTYYQDMNYESDTLDLGQWLTDLEQRGWQPGGFRWMD